MLQMVAKITTQQNSAELSRQDFFIESIVPPALR
jgi:hypothetical protein